ncbi:MAG: hypothetical protein LBV51_04000, partial [Acholeplasmatales bacterium]|nr:hypothetical protein [Acholeplasmatales bacterium]
MSEKNRVYTISNFPIRLGELFKNIKKYDPAFVVDTFVSNKIHFHKNLRINALKEALRKPTDKIYYERKTLADEITYHLRFFDLYSEFCLQNYLYLLTDEEKVDYMLLLLANMLDTLSYKQISLDFLKVFLNEPAKNTKYDFYNLENELNKIFVDKYENVELDGLKIDLLRKVLYNSLSSADIYKFGLKYGVTIPKRLKKNELIGYVLQRLNLASERENTYTREKLEKMPPIIIERFAKDNNISIGSDLKKEDMIEYVLANHGSVKLYYRRPETIDAYSFTEEEKKQFNLIAEKVVEQPKPTVEVLVNKPVVASKQPIKEKEVVVVEGPTKVIIKENLSVSEGKSFS